MISKLQPNIEGTSILRKNKGKDYGKDIADMKAKINEIVDEINSWGKALEAFLIIATENMKDNTDKINQLAELTKLTAKSQGINADNKEINNEN